EMNLCNNAFDAMQGAGHKFQGTGGYEPKLTVLTKSENGSVIIEVQDNGPGIPDEIKDKILQPFFTTKKGTQGTGLGLSIANDIVKAHRGTLSIAESHETGTIFRIELRSNQ
ncbi:MAG: sensor histidine kinase, partial [Balneolaceae bacterium]